MNPVTHFEIPGDDMERMKKFYSSAFGWKLQELGPEMNNYVVAQTDETDEQGMLKKTNRINGGLFSRKGGNILTPGPSFVMAVENMEAAMARINASGGKVLSEAVEIPSIGKYATFEDTEGNRLSILEPARPM
jgi:predicted enzyme related to lactoylglutathione lyase